MLLSKRNVKDTRIFDIEGEVNLFNCRRLKEEMQNAVDSGVCKHIIVNFKDIPYIDSTGIGTLIAARIHLEKAGGSISLINVGKEVMKVMQTTKMVNYFNIFDAEEEALATIGSE